MRFVVSFGVSTHQNQWCRQQRTEHPMKSSIAAHFLSEDTPELAAPDQGLEQMIGQFWQTKTPYGDFTKNVSLDGHPAIQMTISQYSETESEDFDVQSFEARWFENGRAIAYAIATVVGPHYGGAHMDYFIEALDEIDQDACDFGELLIQTHRKGRPFNNPHQELYYIAKFNILEVHPECRNKGIGVQLGKIFLEAMSRRFLLAFTVLKPFPLQYSQGDGPRVYIDPETSPNQFKRDVAKLSTLYYQAWSAKPLPGNPEFMFIQGSNNIKLISDGQKWWMGCPTRFTRPYSDQKNRQPFKNELAIKELQRYPGDTAIFRAKYYHTLALRNEWR